MAHVMCLLFSTQEEDFLEYTNAKCHMSTFRVQCNMCIHLVTLENIHTHAMMLVSTLERQVCELEAIVKLLVISLTQHTPQTRVSGTIPHVTLKALNGVLGTMTFTLNYTIETSNNSSTDGTIKVHWNTCNFMPWSIMT